MDQDELNGAITYGCQAHWMNLVIGDILRDTKRAKVVADATLVLTAFRRTHALSQALKTLKVKRPPLPCCTRWGTTTAALSYYNHRWAFMAQAAATHLPPGHLVRRILETPGSSRSVLDLLNMLVIPTQAVFLLEKASTTIADAVEIWLHFYTALNCLSDGIT